MDWLQQQSPCLLEFGADAGLLSLRKMSKRLHEDHANAQTLAHGIAELPWVSASPRLTSPHLTSPYLSSPGVYICAC